MTRALWILLLICFIPTAALAGAKNGATCSGGTAPPTNGDQMHTTTSTVWQTNDWTACIDYKIPSTSDTYDDLLSEANGGADNNLYGIDNNNNIGYAIADNTMSPTVAYAATGTGSCKTTGVDCVNNWQRACVVYHHGSHAMDMYHFYSSATGFGAVTPTSAQGTVVTAINNSAESALFIGGSGTSDTQCWPNLSFAEVAIWTGTPGTTGACGTTDTSNGCKSLAYLEGVANCQISTSSAGLVAYYQLVSSSSTTGDKGTAITVPSTWATHGGGYVAHPFTSPGGQADSWTKGTDCVSAAANTVGRRRPIYMDVLGVSGLLDYFTNPHRLSWDDMRHLWLHEEN